MTQPYQDKRNAEKGNSQQNIRGDQKNIRGEEKTKKDGMEKKHTQNFHKPQDSTQKGQTGKNFGNNMQQETNRNKPTR